MCVTLTLTLMSAVLNSATQQTSRKFSGNCWTEYLNTKVPLSTLLHAGYSVNLKKKSIKTYEFSMTLVH